jgi:hypothetical protein
MPWDTRDCDCCEWDHIPRDYVACVEDSCPYHSRRIGAMAISVTTSSPNGAVWNSQTAHVPSQAAIPTTAIPGRMIRNLRGTCIVSVRSNLIRSQDSTGGRFSQAASRASSFSVSVSSVFSVSIPSAPHPFVASTAIAGYSPARRLERAARSGRGRPGILAGGRGVPGCRL